MRMEIYRQTAMAVAGLSATRNVAVEAISAAQATLRPLALIEGVETPLAAVTVDLGALRQRPEWSDHMVWGVLYRGDAVFGVVPLYADTKPTRKGLVDHIRALGCWALAFVVVPFADSADDQCTLRVMVPAGGAVQGVSPAPTESSSSVLTLLPTVSLSATGSQVVAEVRDATGALHDATLFWETTAGLFAAARTQTVQGSASNTVVLLAPGVSAKVKAGFKHYPAKAEIVITG